MIDGHTHMLQGRRPLESLKRRVEDLDVNFADLFEKMDQIGLEKMVTLAQEMTRVSKAWLGSNDLTINLQEKFPKRIVGIIAAEPIDERDVFNIERLREFRSAVKEHGMKGLLFTPPYGHFYANDKKVYPFYEAAVELDVAIYFHQAGPAPRSRAPSYFVPLKYSRPIVLDDVAIDFPDLRINVEHMGYPWTEELLTIMRHAPNVYTDISQLLDRPTLLAWYLTMAKEYGVIDRVFWGSDYVGEDIVEYFKIVQGEITWISNNLNKSLTKSGWPTLTQEEIIGILSTNVRRLLKL